MKTDIYHRPHTSIRALILLIAASTSIISCSGKGDKENHTNVYSYISLYQEKGFKYKVIDTGYFNIAVFYRLQSKNNTRKTTIYIEGDGNAWRTRILPSTDPTPKKSLLLSMAEKDYMGNVIYIARPCQMLEASHKKNCHLRFWTTHRYSLSVINAVSNTISTIKDNLNIKGQLGVIGYSGGGVVGSLVSVSRDDIDWLITVAANLSHQRWTKNHNITPLYGSLNLEDYIEELQVIPQIHFRGDKDDIVSRSALTEILNKFEKHTTIITIPGYSHYCCWAKNWEKLLTQAKEELDKKDSL